jgi:hypothetical protein
MPFVKKQKPTDSTLPGVLLAPPQAPTVNEFQLECSKARRRVEDFSSQLDAARLDFARISGQSVADDTLDIAAVATAMSQAQTKVEDIEKALAVATQRLEAAEVARANAADRVQRDELRKTLIRLGNTARAVDAWVDSGKPIIEAYHACRKDVLDFGVPDLATIINVANLSFTTYLFRSCAPMANCSTGYAVFQTDPRWARPWSMSNPPPDLADTVKFT